MAEHANDYARVVVEPQVEQVRMLVVWGRVVLWMQELKLLLLLLLIVVLALFLKQALVTVVEPVQCCSPMVVPMAVVETSTEVIQKKNEWPSLVQDTMHGQEVLSRRT